MDSGGNLRQVAADCGKVVFTVDVGDGGGHIERDSAVYSRATTADGRATITLLTDPECEDRKETVLLAVGSGLSLPDEPENRLFSLLPDLEKESRRAWDFIDQL